MGLGDGLSLGYTNTDGSNGFDISYTFPLNPRNGTLNLSYGNTSSHVIEPPFDLIDIESSSRYFDLTFRQPVIQTPSRELALGLTASRRESNTSLLDIPFPLSEGADQEGRTRISALRFFQEWTQRGTQEVIALRSQFNIGLGVLNATVNDNSPDSRFLSWPDIALSGGTLKTAGGRIELGSVGANSFVSLNPIDKGYALGYDGVSNFR